MRIGSYPWADGSVSSASLTPKPGSHPPCPRFRWPPGLDYCNSLLPRLLPPPSPPASSLLPPGVSLAGHQSAIPKDEEDPTTAPCVKPIPQRELSGLEAYLDPRAPPLCRGGFLRGRCQRWPSFLRPPCKPSRAGFQSHLLYEAFST